MGKEAAARSSEPSYGVDPDEIEAARAGEYGLIARLIARAPDAELLRGLSRLVGDATPIGLAHAGLAAAAAETRAKDVAREHFGLFVGVGRGEIVPHASYYVTGFLNERPLADLRQDLARLGVTRAAGVHEPEDHLAILCDVMAGLARGDFDADAAAERTFFERHLAPWAERCFADIERAKGARFYRAVGRFGAAFLAVEAEAFGLMEEQAHD
jgi:TorA maturation chaperone TorD